MNELDFLTQDLDSDKFANKKQSLIFLKNHFNIGHINNGNILHNLNLFLLLVDGDYTTNEDLKYELSLLFVDYIDGNKIKLSEEVFDELEEVRVNMENQHFQSLALNVEKETKKGLKQMIIYTLIIVGVFLLLMAVGL